MLKALITQRRVDKYQKYYEEKFDLSCAGQNVAGYTMDAVLKGDEIIEKAQGQDIFILSYEQITREVLKNLPDLKLIISERDGPEENIDIEACTEFGIPVISADGRCAESVAELILMYMLALSRRLVSRNNRMKEQGMLMDAEGEAPDKELFQKTLSIIGCGRNGKALRRLVTGFDMRVLVYDPYMSDELAAELNVEKVDLDTAMSEGDYVTLLARVTEETTGLVSAEKIALMKESAILVNCGRPALYDEAAAIKAVDEGKIFGLGLDVFNNEFEPGFFPEYFKLSDEKLNITPHIAGTGDKRVDHQYENTIDGLERFEKGEISTRVYNPKVVDSPEFANRGGVIFGSAK